MLQATKDTGVQAAAALCVATYATPQDGARLAVCQNPFKKNLKIPLQNLC